MLGATEMSSAGAPSPVLGTHAAPNKSARPEGEELASVRYSRRVLWLSLSLLGVLVFGPQEQQDQFPLQKVLKVAATEREFGNYLFRQNRFYDAKVRYKRVRML